MSKPAIRENPDGSIVITGIIEEQAHTPTEMLGYGLGVQSHVLLDLTLQLPALFLMHALTDVWRRDL